MTLKIPKNPTVEDLKKLYIQMGSLDKGDDNVWGLLHIYQHLEAIEPQNCGTIWDEWGKGDVEGLDS